MTIPRARRHFDATFKLQVVQMIDQWQEKAETTRLCSLLGVSRPGAAVTCAVA